MTILQKEAQALIFQLAKNVINMVLHKPEEQDYYKVKVLFPQKNLEKKKLVTLMVVNLILILRALKSL